MPSHNRVPSVQPQTIIRPTTLNITPALVIHIAALTALTTVFAGDSNAPHQLLYPPTRTVHGQLVLQHDPESLVAALAPQVGDVFDRCESLSTERSENVEDACQRVLGAGVGDARGHCGYEDGIWSAALDDKHVWRVNGAVWSGGDLGSNVTVIGGGVLYGFINSAAVLEG